MSSNFSEKERSIVTDRYSDKNLIRIDGLRRLSIPTNDELHELKEFDNWVIEMHNTWCPYICDIVEECTDIAISNEKKKSERISKDQYYLDIAKTVASRGTCLRRNFGSIIVKNDVIVSTGYVGAPRGRKNCCDLGTCARQKQNIPRGERYELCLERTSKIRLDNGKITTLSDMFSSNNNKPQRFTVLSYHKGYVIYVTVDHPILVGERDGVCVTFGDGSLIRCTPDHKIMITDGSYREAQQLKPHDDVMGYKVNEDHTTSIISKRVVSVEPLSDTIFCFDLSVPPTLNFGVECGNNSGIFVHNCRSVHSEMNAIINGNRDDMIDSTLYLYGTEKDGTPVKDTTCCAMCKRAVINARIKTVVTLGNDGDVIRTDVSDWIDNDESLTLQRGY